MTLALSLSLSFVVLIVVAASDHSTGRPLLRSVLPLSPLNNKTLVRRCYNKLTQSANRVLQTSTMDGK